MEATVHACVEQYVRDANIFFLLLGWWQSEKGVGNDRHCKTGAALRDCDAARGEERRGQGAGGPQIKMSRVRG